MAEMIEVIAGPGRRRMVGRARPSFGRAVGATALVAGAFATAAAQTTHTVQLLDMSFEPSDLKIRLGDTVHWVWVSSVHNVESGVVENKVGVHDGRFRSGDPDFDLTFDLRFDRAFIEARPAPGAVYPYYCLVHYFVGMVGTIRVTILGDFDNDLDVDLDDSALFAGCLSGPDRTVLPFGCTPLEFNRADMDDDGDVDLRDLAAFQQVFGG
jgi:plastocyanin